MLRDIIDRRTRVGGGDMVLASVQAVYDSADHLAPDPAPRRCSVAEAVAWASGEPYKVDLVLESAS